MTIIKIAKLYGHMSGHVAQTCIWPSPPGLNQSDPQRSFYQQRTGEILEDVIIEDG